MHIDKCNNAPGPAPAGWVLGRAGLGLAWGGTRVVGEGDSCWHCFLCYDTFPIIVFVPEQLHINDGELLSSVHCMVF